MTWRDLCFLHWPVAPDALRDLIPPGLEIDTFDGSAWIGVVPFEMRDTRFIRLPAVPGTRHFPELNLRTYVRGPERAGVWFFSLDAASRLAVRGARATFALPYFDATMKIDREGDAVRYRSERRSAFGAPPARFVGGYRPIGPVETSRDGTLEHFLTERYCLFAQAGYGVPRSLRRGLVRGDIFHDPWPLQQAECELEACDMFRLARMDAPSGEPLAHFAREIRVEAWAPIRIDV
ncbi:MAG: DUF2071 domain-containing protein [Planctomycetota bacterium]